MYKKADIQTALTLLGLLGGGVAGAAYGKTVPGRVAAGVNEGGLGALRHAWSGSNRRSLIELMQTLNPDFQNAKTLGTTAGAGAGALMGGYIGRKVGQPSKPPAAPDLQHIIQSLQR